MSWPAEAQSVTSSQTELQARSTQSGITPPVQGGAPPPGQPQTSAPWQAAQPTPMRVLVKQRPLWQSAPPAQVPPRGTVPWGAWQIVARCQEPADSKVCTWQLFPGVAAQPAVSVQLRLQICTLTAPGLYV